VAYVRHPNFDAWSGGTLVEPRGTLRRRAAPDVPVDRAQRRGILDKATRMLVRRVAKGDSISGPSVPGQDHVISSTTTSGSELRRAGISLSSAQATDTS
jgi:hypothetical protein